MIKSESFGDLIRRHREDQALPLRKVAAYLDIDQAVLSKIERGKRKATREQVLGLAKFYKTEKNHFLVAWLSDKIVGELADDRISLQALQVAEEKIANTIRRKAGRSAVFKKIRNILIDFPAIENAWIFGSFARKEDTQDSDIDILIDVPEKTTFTLFDIAEIQEKLKHSLNRKVDLVMFRALRPQVRKRIQQDLKLIYEKRKSPRQGKV